MLRKSTKILVLVLGISVLPIISLAQINIDMPYTLSNELGVDIVPQYPNPYQKVSVSLSLYTEDLNSADISWYKNGKLDGQGKGKTTYTFATGAAGDETKIEARIKLLSGISFSKSFNINPAGVDLVWEANSYVPPFYKGKALHPRQGSLKIVATPNFVKNGKRISAGNLIYKWSNGVNVYQSQSGYGKNVVTIDGSLLGKEEQIEILVTDPVNNLVAHGLLNISPVDPEIVFYENSPYYGHLFDTAVNEKLDLKSAETQIMAAPYFFSNEEDGLLTYKWRLNNTSISSLSGSRTAIFKKPEGESGQSVISLEIENLDRILQQADANMTINFEK